MREKLLNRNINIVYVITFLRSFIFFVPILALYLEEQLFTTVNVTIILAIITLGTAVLEVPSGAFADVFGRKRTIILANLMAVLSATMLAVSSHFMLFVIYAIIAAFNRSLYSGTDESLLYDSLKELGEESQFKKIIGRNHAVAPLGLSIASIIGGFLATFSLRTPVAVTVFPLVVAFFGSLFLIEPRYHKELDHNVFHHIKRSFVFIKSNSQLIILILASLLFFAFGESIHQISQIFYKFNAIPVAYFGIIFFIVFGLSSLGSLLSHSISEKLGNKRTLVFMTILSIIFILLATYSSGLVAAGFLVLGSIPYGIRNPILSYLTNAEVKSENRTTVLSIRNLASSIGFSLFAPILGLLTDYLGIITAYRIFAVAYCSLVIVFFFLREKGLTKES